MAFFTPFLLGAGQEYSRRLSESDQIAGNITDLVAKQVLTELAKEKENIKSQVALKDSFTSIYGSKFSNIMDSVGAFESGKREETDEFIKRAFSTDSLLDLKTKIDNLPDDKYKDLPSFILNKKARVEDKQQFVNKQFSDVPNLRRIMLEGREVGGGEIGKALFGDVLTQKDVPVAVEKLSRAAGGPIPEPMKVDTQGLAKELGVKPFSQLSFAELDLLGSPSAQREVNSIRKEAQLRYQKEIELKVPMLNEYKSEYNNAKTLYEFKTGKPYTLNLNNYVIENIFLPDVVKEGGRSFGKKIERIPIFRENEMLEELAKISINPLTKRRYTKEDIPLIINIGQDGVMLNNLRQNLSQERKEILNNRLRLVIIEKLKRVGVTDVNKLIDQNPQYRF